MERNNMKIKDEIEELNAKFDHLQYRFDNLRDYVKENPTSDYYWNRFEDLLVWSLKFDPNSEEYSRLNKAAWMMLDQYIEILFTSAFHLKGK